MPTLQDIKDEVQTLASQINERVELLDKEQKKLGEALTSQNGQMPAEYKESFERINGKINLLMDKIEQIEQKERIEAARPLRSDGEKKSAQHAAFLKSMRVQGNIEMLSPEEKSLVVHSYMPAEKKALYSGDATQGGFFAAPEYINELFEYLLLMDNLRKICRVVRTGSQGVEMASLTSDASAYWATEQSSYSDSNEPGTQKLSIPVHEMRGRLKVSEQNLEDSSFDLEAWIKTRLMKKFAQKEGQAFVNGDGIGKPRGILNYPKKASSSYAGGSAGLVDGVYDAIPFVVTGEAANINANSILNVLMDLKEDYEMNATYIFTRGTLNSIRLFKDTTGQPLWQPFGASNLPGTIYGRPYQTVPSMPQIGAGNFPIIVGDFDNYMIVDRLSMNMRRLDELYADAGLVGFIARLRVGGNVLVPESFRLLKCSA